MVSRVLISVTIIFCVSSFLFSQERGTKYTVHPIVGDVIDAAEAKKYSIFSQFEGFKQAIFYKVNDTTFYAELQFIKNDSLINLKRSFKGYQIDAITEKIEFVNLQRDVNQFQTNLKRPFSNSEYGYRLLYYPRLSIGGGISYKYTNFDNISEAFTRIEDKIIQTILDSGKQNIYPFSRRDKNFSLGPLLHVNIRYMFSPEFEVSSSMMWGSGETDFYSAQIYVNSKFPDIINKDLVPFAGVGLVGTRINIAREYNQTIAQYNMLKKISFHASGFAVALNAGLSLILSQYFNTQLNILYPFYSTLSQSNSDGSQTEFNLKTLEVGLLLSVDI